MPGDGSAGQGRRFKPGARASGAHLNAGRSETAMERWDRNFTELLQELRVAQTGVQILFAFLLSLPFTNRFGAVDGFDRVLYLATVLSAAAVVLRQHHRG